MVQEASTHPALWLGTRGLCAPLVGQAERAVLADQECIEASRSCPWAAWKDGFSGQKPEVKSTAATRAVCRAMEDFGGEAHLSLREEQ